MPDDVSFCGANSYIKHQPPGTPALRCPIRNLLVTDTEDSVTDPEHFAPPSPVVRPLLERLRGSMRVSAPPLRALRSKPAIYPCSQDGYPSSRYSTGRLRVASARCSREIPCRRHPSSQRPTTS